MTSRYHIIDACKLLLIKFAACRQREWSVLFIEVCFTLTVGTSLIIVLLFLCRSQNVTDIPAVHKSRSSSTRKNVGIAFSVVFAVILVVFLAIIFHKRSRRQVLSFPFNTKIMNSVYVNVLHQELITPDRANLLLGLRHGVFADRFIFRFILSFFISKMKGSLLRWAHSKYIRKTKGKLNVIKRKTFSGLNSADCFVGLNKIIPLIINWSANTPCRDYMEVARPRLSAPDLIHCKVHQLLKE